MKGITGHSALEAYRRVALTPVNPSPAAAPSAGATKTERHPAEAAKVSISTEARQLAQSEAHEGSQKVENLKAAVKDGSFKVNSRLVAERMVDSLG